MTRSSISVGTPPIFENLNKLIFFVSQIAMNITLLWYFLPDRNKCHVIMTSLTYTLGDFGCVKFHKNLAMRGILRYRIFEFSQKVNKLSMNLMMDFCRKICYLSEVSEMFLSPIPFANDLFCIGTWCCDNLETIGNPFDRKLTPLRSHAEFPSLNN